MRTLQTAQNVRDMSLDESRPFAAQGIWTGAQGVDWVTETRTNIADKIEADLQYPGEIKVSVIRETRVIEYAR